MEPRIPIDPEQIAAFCQKWKIVELALFGSVLRDDFGPESDVDVLVTFAADAKWRVSHMLSIQDELRFIFGRQVDVLVRPDVERMSNYIRRKSILSGSARIYAQ